MLDCAAAIDMPPASNAVAESIVSLPSMINPFAVGLLAISPTLTNASVQRVVPAETIRESSGSFPHQRVAATQIPPAIAANLQQRVNLAVTMSRGCSAEQPRQQHGHSRCDMILFEHVSLSVCRCTRPRAFTF